MLFAHDTELALAAAAALVNTIDDDGDHLGDIAALDDFVAEWNFAGTHQRTRQELAEVRALRPRLRRMWQSDKETLVGDVNDLLREAKALPQLVKHDELDYHLHATPLEAPLAKRMAVEAAMALVDVVRSGELDRLRVCDLDDCEGVTVDLTKNKSKRYCSAACSNRAAVTAYRTRARAAHG